VALRCSIDCVRTFCWHFAGCIICQTVGKSWPGARQAGHRVQKVRHDRGEEYMGGSLKQFYVERGVQMEPTSAYAPEANGIAERHNLRLLDMARPMLADAGDARHGLGPLNDRFAGDVIVYANDLYDVMPASGAQVGRSPSEGFLGRTVTLDVFWRFGCRVWVHTPGKPFVHHPKFAPRARPGRFLGFERSMGSGIFRVLLDSGQIVQSQSVVFADTPQPPLPVPPLSKPSPVLSPPGRHEHQLSLADDDSDDEVDLHSAALPPASPLAPPSAPPLVPGLSLQQTSGSEDGNADEVILHRVAMQAPAAGPVPVNADVLPVGRPERASRNKNPKNAFVACRPQAQGGSLSTRVGRVGGIRGVPDSDSHRPTTCSNRLVPVYGARGGAGMVSRPNGAKHKSQAARVQARHRWRCAANNVAHNTTAQRGVKQNQVPGAKRDYR
jgi:hypothetical protein